MKNFLFPVNLRWGQRPATLLLSALLSIFCTQAALAQDGPRTAGVYKMSDLTYRVWINNPASR